MSKFAIVQIAGKQYKVSEGDVLTVDRLDTPESEKLVVTDVLLVGDDKKVSVGIPLVEKSKVTFEVVSHPRDEKIRVFKYKSKSRYRKTHGHRSALTQLKVAQIA
jgi:large subunit ribosomal protein L21